MSKRNKRNTRNTETTEIQIGNKYRYFTDKYDYNFIILKVDKSIHILVQENYKIYKLSPLELYQSIKNKHVRPI